MNFLRPLGPDGKRKETDWRTKVRKWWTYSIRFAWFSSILFFAQNAIASRLENEPRAALLYWMIIVVLVLAGGIASLNRRINMG